MKDLELEQLKYPVGKFSKPESIDEAQISDWVDTIAQFPAHVERLTKNLTTRQKNWKYRPDGWNIKQVVHHCADSHINGYIRFKLVVTENQPSVQPYFEDRWANLADGKEDDLADSMLLTYGVHNRMTTFLNSLTSEQWNRELLHPEHDHILILKEYIGMYAWHCDHHLQHIVQAIESEGKYN